MIDVVNMPGVLARVRDALVSCGVRHVFIGALPVLAWGRPRGTTDFDVVVFCEPAELERLTAAFGERGMDRKRDEPSSDPADPLPDMLFFYTRESPSTRIDVFVAKLDFERAVLETAQNAEILGSQIPVASCEASIIYELLASRPKDVDDVQALFKARADIGQPLDWNFLDHWAAEWEISDRLAEYRERYRPA